MNPQPSSSDLSTWLLAGEALRVIALTDALIEAVGYDARSAYAEAYWLGVVGPSTLLALRRLNAGLDDHPEGFQVPLTDLARELGLGHGSGRYPLFRTLSRLVCFGLAAVHGEALAVRRSVPPLSRRHLARLPLGLVERHQLETAGRARAATVQVTGLTA